MSTHPKNRASTYTIEWKGQKRPLTVRDCRACLGGEFAGNLDLRIASGSVSGEELTQRLKVQTPFDPEPLDVVGSGRVGDDIELTFGCEAMAARGRAPESVQLLFEGKTIGELPCRTAGSARLDSSDFLDPSQILQGRPTPPAEALGTGRWRGPLLAAFGLTLTAISVALIGAGIAANGIAMSPLVGAGLFVGLFGDLCLVLLCIPYTQVRLDPIRGRVSEARGRWLFGFRELETTHHAVSSFSHVRLLERSRKGDDGPEDVFLLLLEGPIEWAGDEGEVHVRPDAVALCEFGSLEVARVHAAQVASVLGLRVLSAGG